jgi:uncharacterized protein
MTPEERQLLAALADRIKAAPVQQRDAEADDALRLLVQQRPDTAYLLAQTVLMQDFALRNAQAQITDLQNRLQAAEQAKPASGGSFLGNLFGSSPPPPPARPARPQYRPPGPSTVPPAGPWARQAPPPGAGYYIPPGAPVLQPAQSSSFLQQAATTAVGIAGGALLFEGIQSLFAPHYGTGFLGGPWAGGYAGGFGGGWAPTESLSETTIVNNNYYDDRPQDVGQNQAFDDRSADYQPDSGSDPAIEDTDFDPGPDLSNDGGFSDDDDFI